MAASVELGEADGSVLVLDGGASARNRETEKLLTSFSKGSFLDCQLTTFLSNNTTIVLLCSLKIKQDLEAEP